MLALLLLSLSAAATSIPSSSSSEPASQPSDATDVFSIFEEERIVITGAAKASKVRESPTSVWVIDRKTLEMAPMATLYDALRTVPGINIIEYTQGHSEANLRFIGSFPEHQSLTLVDGRPAASDSLGYFDYSLVDPRLVERIEVVLGPSSTLYGANAFNGVVNIVTREPAKRGHHLRLAADGGFTTGSPGIAERERYRAGALVGGHASYGYGWGSGGARLSFSGAFIQTGGAQAIYTPSIIGTPVRQGLGTLDVVQEIGQWRARLQLGAALKRSPYLFLELDDAQQQDYYAHLLLERTALAGADDRLSVSLWAKHNEVRFDATYAGIEQIPFLLRTTSTELRTAYTLPTFHDNNLTIGLQARGIFNDVGDPAHMMLLPPGRKQLLAGIFVEDNYRPIEPLILTAGLRLDTREMEATRAFRYLSFSPRASVVWLINADHSLRLEYASAFRTPTAVERALIVSASDGRAIVQGNLDLRNERIHSFTLAYMGRKQWFSARAEAYVARSQDNIIPVLESVNSDTFDVGGVPLYIASPDSRFKYPFYFYNVNGFWIPGASIKLGAEPSPRWRAFLTYMFMPSPLTHRVGLTTEWQPLDRLRIGAQLFYYAGVRTAFFVYPHRLIVNLKASYALDAAGRWTVALNLMNAFDARIALDVPLTEDNVRAWRESIAGGRLGPRAWASIEYGF